MSLDDILSKLDPKVAKQFKKAADVETIRYPLASIGLNNALGGGIGAGRIAVVYGGYSVGKSMLCLQSVAGFQKQGLSVAWADVEGAFDKEFAQKLGVDTNELIITGSKSSEKLGNQLVELVKAGVDIIVVDSISAIMPATFVEKDGELKGSDDRKQIGAHAKAIKSVIDGLLFNNEKTAIILISQLTTKMETWGARQVFHGGNSPGFAASQIIKLTSSNTDAKQKKGVLVVGDKKIEQPIGRTVDAVIEKNKLGRQSTTTSYDIYYAGETIGIDALGELVDMSTDFGVLSKGGAWFEFEGQKFQGRDSVIEAVQKDQVLKNELEKRLDSYLSAG